MKHINRSSIVLLPEDERIIGLIKSRQALSSRTQAIRFALRQAVRSMEYEKIQKSYLERPESKEDLAEAEAIFKVASTGMRKEKW